MLSMDTSLREGKIRRQTSFSPVKKLALCHILGTMEALSKHVHIHSLLFLTPRSYCEQDTKIESLKVCRFQNVVLWA